MRSMEVSSTATIKIDQTSKVLNFICKRDDQGRASVLFDRRWATAWSASLALSRRAGQAWQAAWSITCLRGGRGRGQGAARRSH